MVAEYRPVEPLGREPELAVIDDFLRRMPAGPSALQLHGEAGIGKTTLWNHAVARARGSSIAVMACRPTPAESDLPYLGLGDLLAFAPVDILSGLPEPQLKSLEIALLIAEAESSPLQQRAVAVAVLNVLLAMARTAAVLVAIDDAQWLDVATLRILRFAVRRTGRAPIGFLVVTRTGGGEQDLLGLDASGRTAAVRHLNIGPLGQPAIDHLLRSRLGASLAGHVLRRLQQASGGNPLFALELGRVVLDSPDLSDAGRPLAVPASLTDLVGTRLSRLPKATRECLLVAAALSRPTVDLIRLASPRPRGVIDALTVAVDAGVIELEGASVRFVHPVLAGVMYSQASAADARRLHHRLAALVQDPEERARHLGLSVVAPDGAVALAITEGAVRAAGRGAPDVAAALFEQAARLTPSNDALTAASRKLGAADQHMALGDTAHARVLLKEVASQAEAGLTRARALHRLGWVEGVEAGSRAASPWLLRAIDEAGQDPALTVAIERDLAFTMVQMGDPVGALPHARAAYRAALSSGQHTLVAEALDQLCMAEFITGNEVPAGLLERAMTIDRDVGATLVPEHPGFGAGRFGLALALKWTGRFGAARQLLQAMLSEHTNRGDEGSLDTVLFHLAELELWAGNWQAASELRDAARELAAHTGQAQTERRGLLLAAMLDEGRGNVDAARSRAQACLALCEQTDDPPAAIRCLGLLGRLELSLRHPADAVEYLQRGVVLELQAGYDPSCFRILGDAIEGWTETGRLAEAQAAVQRLVSLGAKADREWAAATGARGQALLQAAAGRLAQGLVDLERALEIHERMGQPFEHGRTLLALGTFQRRLKKKRDARETFERALGIFEALGAQTWVELTRAERGRIGGRPPSRHELTSTEARVAQLVADGLTNREVASAMFLSQKTIETNLTRIYSKLAVDSRRELAKKVRAGQPQG